MMKIIILFYANTRIKDKWVRARTSFENKCFTSIIPKQYDYISPTLSNNIDFYKEIEGTLKLIENGYNIILFGSGFSGSGKTYTLIDAPDSVLKQYFNKLNNTNIELYVFEQYGKLNINDGMKLDDIFSGSKSQFSEKIYIYNQLNDKINEVKINPKQKLDGLINDTKNNILKNKSITDIINVLNQIKKYRIEKNRIRVTINNKESSRGHIYYLFKINFSSGKVGYMTIIDMGGQESPKEIMLDYMGGDSESFKNYFDLLYGLWTNYKPKKELGNINLNKKSINDIIEKVIKLIESFKKQNIIEEDKNIHQLDLTQKWFYLTFKYPLLVFTTLLSPEIPQIPFKITRKQTFDNMIKQSKIKTNDKILYMAKSSLSVLTNDESTQAKIIISLEKIKNTIKNFKKKLTNIYDTPITYQDLFITFLEGFYINDTLISKMRYLKNEQGFEIKEEMNKFEPIYNEQYNPYYMMIESKSNNDLYYYGNNETYSIFDLLVKLSKNPVKFIELSAIRGDIPSDILYTNSLYYKYAYASCNTLKASAMLAGTQCPVDNKCIIDKPLEQSPYIKPIIGGAALSVIIFNYMPLVLVIVVLLLIFYIIFILNDLYANKKNVYNQQVFYKNIY